MVAYRVVANEDGWVFWYTQEAIEGVTKLYGFPIGYPNHLQEFGCPITERIVNIQGDGRRLIVSRLDKNTAKLTQYSYERMENGKFSVSREY